jgi:hypothetical protein
VSGAGIWLTYLGAKYQTDSRSLQRIVEVTMAENYASDRLPIACEPHSIGVVRVYLPALSARLNTPMCRALWESV